MEPSDCDASALILISVETLKKSPGRGHKIDTCGGRSLALGSAWSTLGQQAASRTWNVSFAAIFKFFITFAPDVRALPRIDQQRLSPHGCSCPQTLRIEFAACPAR